MVLYALMIATTLFAWLPPTKPLAFGSMAAFLVYAWFSGAYDFRGFGFAVLMGLLVWGMRHPKASKLFQVTAALGAIVLAMAMGNHLLPGFTNTLVIDQVRFSPLALPFDMYLNFDKPLFALYFLLFYGSTITMQTRLVPFAKTVLKTLGALTVVIIPTALLAHYVAWDPKVPAQTLIWAVNNLLVVAVAEEIFFRGFVQATLARMLRSLRGYEWIALVIASVLFGLAHIWASVSYAVFAGLAGLFYGYAFKATKSIEASILVHFGLNMVHFIFFTYPALSH